MSGKFGEIRFEEDGMWEMMYMDLYLLMFEGLGSFFGNRSIVFYYFNKIRISCVNFEKVEGGVSSSVMVLLMVMGNGSYIILFMGGVSIIIGGGLSIMSDVGVGMEMIMLFFLSGVVGLRGSVVGVLVVGVVVMFML